MPNYIITYIKRNSLQVDSGAVNSLTLDTHLDMELKKKLHIIGLV